MKVRNRELFYRDPAETEIPNLGVAKVKNPEGEAEWRTLEWELKSFVCEGEYERGLQRILDSFLTHLSQPEQPAVWVSGFYGSGKSHLVRVLEYVWRDVRLPSGKAARSLTALPEDIQRNLIELSNAGKRAGGLWSAGGTLGAGSSESVRLAFLSVVFDAAGLPTQYAPARFAIWLKQNNLFDAVRDEVHVSGRTLGHELNNMYVSPYLAEALLKLDAASVFTGSPGEVSKTLQAQYPPNVKDIGDEELLDTFEDVLKLQSNVDGRLPLTLVVLDEMQQYIGEDNSRALIVQNIVEGCSARFESQVMFVATGQSALTANPTLQKLTDRFTVQVPLSDTDVEAVVRQVILQKKADQIPALNSELERVSGEIDRHLGGTRIGAVAADKLDLVADYPLLPTRRRFWERALRAIDKAGKAGVLRTQLKIVHEATNKVADDPVGHVVGADFVYDQQSAGMLMSGVLLKEIDELVRSLRDGTDDGELKSRLCALIFLISQLPHGGVGDIGLRATAPFLADLLVEDLERDGAQLRKRVPRFSTSWLALVTS